MVLLVRHFLYQLSFPEVGSGNQLVAFVQFFINIKKYFCDAN